MIGGDREMLSITRYSVKNKCLAPWIKFIWHFEAEEADIHYKLLPTDCIDIMLNSSDEMVYEAEREPISAPRLHVNGLRRKHSYIHQTGNIDVWGISCYSYGLYPFVNKSLVNLQDKIVDLFEVSSSLAKKLELSISDGLSIENTIENIEKALCQELQVSDTYFKKACLIYDFLDTENDVTLQSFCLTHKIQTKTFTRNVLSFTGYTPKILRAIRRFQKSGNQLVHQKPEHLSDIAYDNDFADQSHFIREFQRFSGVSPRTFQEQKITIKENTKYSYQ